MKGKGKFIIAIVAIVAIAALLYIQFVWLPKKSAGNPEDFECTAAVKDKQEDGSAMVVVTVKNTSKRDYMSLTARVTFVKDGKVVKEKVTEKDGDKEKVVEKPVELKLGFQEVEAGKDAEKETKITKLPDHDEVKCNVEDCLLK